MQSSHWTAKAKDYLHRLCVDIPSRRVASAGNRAATDLFAEVVASFGFATDCPEFACIDWHQEGVHLTGGGSSFKAQASPYSLGCQACGPLAAVSTLDELESAPIEGRLLLLHGEIASEQLMPKNFSFYNPERHRRIIALLESKRPQAIIAATSRNAQMVGALYPFPLFEDGDFDIPSVYMTAEEGDRLAALVGEQVSLESRAVRIPSAGCNVIARRGGLRHGRVVLFAHIDARIGTPGANDNASGVIVLLLLAELLEGYSGELGIELVAINGEDYYSNPGEMQYLTLNEGRFDNILLGINLDDVGYYRGKVGYSLYDCPPQIASQVERVFSDYHALVPGEPWYQGDHGLFLMKQRPALAITSDQLAELMAEITHSPKDTPEIVDESKLISVSLALRDLLYPLDEGVVG